MITTVTTSTTSTVSTVASTVGISAGLAFIAVICLVAVLMQKESLSAATGTMARALSRALNVAIVPLVLGFLIILVAKAIEVFG